MARAPRVGIGLRAPHYRELAESRPAIDLLEAHAENFFAPGGAAPAWLERLRADYPLSLHGVGLSLGSVDPIDEGHLAVLDRLVRRFEPMLVSEHLSWSSFGGVHANELLPLPYTEEAAVHVAARIDQVQQRLGRELLVENVTAYARFPESSLAEWEFVAEVARRSGCRLLLDVNNAWVNGANHGYDPARFIDAIDPALVGEIHVAGFEATAEGLLDTHAAPVADEVWRLYERAVARMGGACPTIVERDANIPPLAELLAEAARARAVASRAVSILQAAGALA